MHFPRRPAKPDHLFHIRDSDDFDFNNPFLRITRFYSLFDGNALLTDPVVFLERLHKKAFRYGRILPSNLLATLQRLLPEYLLIETANWNRKTCDMRFEWMSLSEWQRRMMIPILDACRHLLDAFPKSVDPLKTPGLFLLDRFKGTCYQAANWIEVGKTEGYSLFSSYKRFAIAKAIYVYPLRKDFRRQLCSL